MEQRFPQLQPAWQARLPCSPQRWRHRACLCCPPTPSRDLRDPGLSLATLPWERPGGTAATTSPGRRCPAPPAAALTGPGKWSGLGGLRAAWTQTGPVGCRPPARDPRLQRLPQGRSPPAEEPGPRQLRQLPWWTTTTATHQPGHRKPRGQTSDSGSLSECQGPAAPRWPSPGLLARASCGGCLAWASAHRPSPAAASLRWRPARFQSSSLPKVPLPKRGPDRN